MKTETAGFAVRVALLVALSAAGCGRGRGPAADSPAKATTEGWQPLFDGKTLAGWARSGFEAGGAVNIFDPFRDGRSALVIEPGMTLSGISWTRGAALPRVNYEITLEAMRLAGSDFFCGLTFPVGPSACTLVVGGWGGEVVGLSSIDRVDASENETSREVAFADQRWYRITVRVTEHRIEAWIDDRKMVDVATEGRVISLRPGEIQKSLPLGIATYMTRAAIRDVRLRRVAGRE